MKEKDHQELQVSSLAVVTIKGVVHKDPLVSFLSWFEIANSLNNDLVWKMVWFATIWAIWTAKNEVVFKGKIWDSEQIFELSKFKPIVRSFKFNTGGSFCGCPSDSSIDGILRNEFGDILALFSKAIDIFDSNKAKLLTIREAMIIFVASKWCSSHTFLLECDNYNVVKWITNLCEVP
ncbi:Uncharacterized protein TCM_011143 [Theobroma cacao]|uniref:RNase H type-1 domain-containing protein n=1 Tax=Theobroma cacao TaxID=3641 RepID=A0A061EA20_THECC|nr:Uncharacterized protein TCM_011143 [Theobroma cacao]